MTLDMIGVVAFDTNLGGLDDSRNIYELLKETAFVARMRFLNPFNRAYVSLFPNSKEAQRQNRTIGGLTAEWDKLTNEALNRDDPEDDEPMWYALKNLKDPETNKPLSFESLRCEMGQVVLAGMETTGHQLAKLLAILACYPHIVEKLLAELRLHGLYGAGARDATFEDLGELTYLSAVIKEGMRLAYVLTGSFLRLVPRDMTILGYRIPRNTIIAALGTRAVMSDEMWGDPHVFRPERWLTGEDMSQKYSLGFSNGPRDCVGQKLAMLEMRFTIVELLKQYHLTLKGTLNDMFENSKDGIAIEALNGIWLQFEPRSTAAE